MTSRRTILSTYAVLVVAGIAASQLMPDWSMLDLGATTSTEMERAILGLAVLYVVLAAIPFVPGAEIGFGLLVLFGAKVAGLVYLGMVGALMLSFVMGRFLPERWTAGLFGALGMDRAERLLAETHALDPADRAGFLAERVPTRMLPFLIRHRYVALAVIFNLPGNTVIGGGGGIGFAAGASRLFGTAGYLATVLVAVAPIPLAVYLLGFRA